MLNPSLIFEQDTILFYRFLQDIVDDPVVKQQLDIIIQEENRHATLLGRLAANEYDEDFPDISEMKASI